MNLFSGFMYNFFIQTILMVIEVKLGRYSEFNILNVFGGATIATVILAMMGFYN